MPITLLTLGACLLHGPLNSVIRLESSVTTTAAKMNIPTAETYSVGEAIQLLRFFAGEIDVPAEVRPFCGLQPEFDSRRDIGSRFFEGDVAVFEPNAPVDLVFEGYCISRAKLFRLITDPIKTTADAARAANVWYHQGLIAGNESLRSEMATKLVEFVPEDFPNRALAVSVLQSLRGVGRSQQDLAGGIRIVRDLLPMPLLLVTYTHQYTPDGRPIPWPPDFVESVIAAAETLGLPYLDPSQMVMQEGVQKALTPDRTHYQEEFGTKMGRAIVAAAAQMLKEKAA